MDTSELYIKMCQKATKIQELRPYVHVYKVKDGKEYKQLMWNDGDIISYYYVSEWGGKNKERSITIIWNNMIPDSGYHNWDSDWGGPDEENEWVWLPRQDQLQDIAFDYLSRGDDTYSIFSLILDFVDFANRPTELLTLEQLWLAYVMKEVYNKIWDDNKEDWMVS